MVVCPPEISYNINVFWFFSCPFQVFRQFFHSKIHALFFPHEVLFDNRFHSFVFTVGAVVLFFWQFILSVWVYCTSRRHLYSVFHFFEIWVIFYTQSQDTGSFAQWKLPFDVSLIKVKKERNDFEKVQKKSWISEGSIRMRIALFLRYKHENKSEWKTISPYWFVFCFTWCYKNYCENYLAGSFSQTLRYFLYSIRSCFYWQRHPFPSSA